MPYLASDIPLHPTRICIEYTAPHSNQDFSVPFPFLQRDHVYVYEKESDVDITDKFEWISDGLIRSTETIAESIIIFRYTPRNALYRVFNDATSITAKEFNEALRALLYAIQEGEEVAAIVDELVNLGHLTQEVRDRLLPSADDKNNLLPTAPNEGDRDGKILEYVGNNREWVHVQNSATKFTPTQANLYPIIKDMLEEGTGIQIRQLDSPTNRLLFNVLNHRYVPTADELFSRFPEILKAGDNVTFDTDNTDHTITINAEGGSSEGGGSSALDEQLGTRVHLLEGYTYLDNPGIVKGQFTIHEDGNIAIAVKDGQSIPEDFRAPGTFIQFNETVWQIMQEVLPQSGATRTFRVRKTIDSPIFPNTGNISFTRGIQRRVLTLENRVDVTEDQHFNPLPENLYSGVKPIIKGSSSVTVTPDDEGHTLTLTSSGGGSSSDLEGAINPQTIFVTAPTSSFTVEPGATRNLEVTRTSGVGYARKTLNASTITLSKQATYRAFATVTVTNNEGSSNGRVTPELIPTGANVTVLEKVAPYVRTENNDAYTVTTSTTFTTSADNSVVGFSIGNQVCLDDRRLLLTAISNIRILPLIGAVGPKGNDGPTFDETKNVRGQVSFFYSDGTHDPISRFHPDQMQRLFGSVSGVGITPSAKRTDVRFLLSGFIPNFTALTELVSVEVNGLSARTRTSGVNAPLEKGEYIGNNLYYDGTLVKGTFALIATLTNQELNNLISNQSEVSFDVRYRAGSVDDIWSLRIPFLSNSEKTDIVPFIPIESVKRGIDIDQVAFSANTITGTASGGNVTVPLRLDLNSGKTKAATTSLVIPVGSSSGGSSLTKIARLPTTGIDENGLYMQLGNGVAGTAAPGLYCRHAGNWQNIHKTRFRLGTATVAISGISANTLTSTGIQVPQMDDSDRLMFTFDAGVFHLTDEKTFEWEWVKTLLTGTVNSNLQNSVSNREMRVTDADGNPILRMRLTSYDTFPATILIARNAAVRGTLKMNVYRK